MNWEEQYIPPNGYGIIYMYVVDNKKYIGQTQKPLKKRHNAHMCGMLVVDRKLRAYKYDMFILCVCPISYLDQYEKYYIQLYDTIYPKGWNFTTGGSDYTHHSSTLEKISKQNKGRLHSEEFKKHLSEIESGERNPFYGKKHTEESRQLIYLNHADFKGEKSQRYGVKHTDESKQLISKNHADFKGENHPRHIRPVLQYTRDGVFVAEYPSVHSAQRQIGISPNPISRCALGYIRTAGGYVWKYEQ